MSAAILHLIAAIEALSAQVDALAGDVLGGGSTEIRDALDRARAELAGQ